LQNNIMQR